GAIVSERRYARPDRAAAYEAGTPDRMLTRGDAGHRLRAGAPGPDLQARARGPGHRRREFRHEVSGGLRRSQGRGGVRKHRCPEPGGDAPLSRRATPPPRLREGATPTPVSQDERTKPSHRLAERAVA